MPVLAWAGLGWGVGGWAVVAWGAGRGLVWGGGLGLASVGGLGLASVGGLGLAWLGWGCRATVVWEEGSTSLGGVMLILEVVVVVTLGGVVVVESEGEVALVSGCTLEVELSLRRSTALRPSPEGRWRWARP